MIILVILNAIAAFTITVAGFVGTGERPVRVFLFAVAAILWVDTFILTRWV
jgi:hypothetical protein